MIIKQIDDLPERDIRLKLKLINSIDLNDSPDYDALEILNPEKLIYDYFY